MTNQQPSNGINVPDNLKYMLKKPRAERDNEGRELEIRRLIEARPGKIISGKDFIEATGATSAMLHVRRLIKGGYVTRHKMPGRGHNYAYKWHAEPLTPRVAALKNGETITRKLIKTELPISPDALASLNDLFVKYCEHKAAEFNGDNVYGVVGFLNWIKQQFTEAEQQRKKELEGKTDGQV